MTEKLLTGTLSLNTNKQTLFLNHFVGHAAMETSVCNLLEPGETVLVCTNGLWGERFADMADRQGNALL